MMARNLVCGINLINKLLTTLLLLVILMSANIYVGFITDLENKVFQDAL